jgi:hypothetical protein
MMFYNFTRSLLLVCYFSILSTDSNNFKSNVYNQNVNFDNDKLGFTVPDLFLIKPGYSSGF